MHAALVLASITQTLTDWVARHGVYAVFGIMAVDALLPAGGELTMLVAGAGAPRALGAPPALFWHTLSQGAGGYVVLSLPRAPGDPFRARPRWGVGRGG